MREEANNWWEQALKDLESAKKNLEIESFYVSAFLSQQATEKALKALYIHKSRDTPGKTHSLLYLGNEVGIPSKYRHSLRKLNPDFILTRYPDVANGVPYELYDEQIASEKIELAEDVLKWVEKEFKR